MSEVQQIAQHTDLKGKKVLLRIDLNMPIQDGVVTDDYRLRASIPTIDFLRNAGAITIIIGHIESKETNSFEVLLPTMQQHIQNIIFCRDIFSQQTKDGLTEAKEGDVFLFENLRKWPGEKANDNNFSQSLAQYADIYVNDAFSVAHRTHASVVGIPQYIPACAGKNMQKEIEELSKTFNPERPFLFILGGAKFETKLPILKKFIQLADTVYVGGALANDIYKAKGYEVGKSLVSIAGAVSDIGEIAKKENVLTPPYVVVENNKTTKHIQDVTPEDIILDADTQSINELGECIKNAKTIVWNGPLGDYERGFTSGTYALAQTIAASDAYSIVGGGDTLAAIKELAIGDDINFISTGGGAMLDFLVNETLPGIECLKA